MKTKFLLSALLLISFCFYSCINEATVKVTNGVPNVMLEKITFDKYGIGSSVLPGETTTKTTISNVFDNVSFPVTSPLKFYMVKGDQRVYLRTKESFVLDKKDDLNIVITENTEVVNMITE